MGLAATRPSLFRAVVLNDIGPELGSEGTKFVRRFIGNDIAFRRYRQRCRASARSAAAAVA